MYASKINALTFIDASGESAVAPILHIVTGEDTLRLLRLSDFDADSDAARIRFSAATGGRLVYFANVVGSGTAIDVQLPASFSAADFAAGRLGFIPALNGDGAAYGSISFALAGQSGTVSEPETLGIDVSAVNDEPVKDYVSEFAQPRVPLDAVTDISFYWN
ncbi:hypothetical protein [Sphingosinicella sp. BN140058]|uniref:hypothetical protein n=1 Tax=Sphingosinicella sp. BN140058 TaxID=1892855 RepID=UPI0010110485|nr:hypothetical protein [Sphingosinicella sp. BN140058]QAY77978.1 hypothetical protein ETR14_16680 [Sphingosinicella sp. BN140058]